MGPFDRFRWSADQSSICSYRTFLDFHIENVKNDFTAHGPLMVSRVRHEHMGYLGSSELKIHQILTLDSDAILLLIFVRHLVIQYMLSLFRVWKPSPVVLSNHLCDKRSRVGVEASPLLFSFLFITLRRKQSKQIKITFKQVITNTHVTIKTKLCDFHPKRITCTKIESLEPKILKN